MNLLSQLIDRIHSAMSELSQRSRFHDSSIKSNMKNFKDSIDFLARFVDCIRYRSNALELTPHLDSVVTKVEALVQKIGEEFLEKTKRDSFFVAVILTLRKSSEEKWTAAFDKWMSMMFELKSDVADALDSFSINSVQCKIPVHDFPNWKNFVMSAYKHVQDAAGYISTYYLQPKGNDIIYVVAPSYLEILLGDLEIYHIKHPKIEAFLTKLGNSVVSAQLLCCQWWSSNSVTPSKDDIRAFLQDIDRMISLTNPEFVDVFLILLRTTERFSTIARLFIQDITKSKKDIFMFLPLRWELISLTDCMRDLKNVMLKFFRFDTKKLLMETASLHQSPFKEEDKGVAQKLVQKIGLIRIEILLRTQITGASSLFKVINEIDSLRSIVGSTTESSNSDGSASTKIMNRILKLMEQVLKEAAMIEKSEPMVLRILLLKTLLIKGELLFLELHDCLSGSFKDYIESLHEGFKLMMPSAIEQPGENFNSEKTGFEAVESVANRIITLYHQILAQQNSSGEILIDMKASSLPDLIDEIKLIMNEFRESYLGFQMPVFPYTNAVGFSHSLQGKLRELLNYEMDLIESIITKEQMLEIIELLHFFQPFLPDPSEDAISHGLKDLCIRVLNLTYEAEYLIDSIILGKKR